MPEHPAPPPSQAPSPARPGPEAVGETAPRPGAAQTTADARRRRRWLTVKRFLPTSLYGRALLIIILPIALMQGAVTWVFFAGYDERVNSRLSGALAGDVAWVVDAYTADRAAFPVVAARARAHSDLQVSLRRGPLPPRDARPSGGADRILQAALAQRLDRPFRADADRLPGAVQVEVDAGRGEVLRVLASRERVSASRAHVFLLWLAGATILLTAVAVVFIKNQVRAIERLAAAAEAFGKGADAPLKPHGAREVRQAARAFLDMRERINRHLDQRTALLASVSHDLRTPLTRLKLELALARPSKKLDAMKRDLVEMEHTIDEYLAFARGEGGEELECVGLRALLDEVAEGARRAGAEVALFADPGLTANVRPNALRRALSNLVMNAAVHGEHVQIAAHPRSSGVEIIVDDDGPGIPADRHEDAFKPFSRLDESRNQNRKGVGLGLAIARDVARSHGGDIRLERSPAGGLRAVLRLP
ncbi:MAG: HAMP domain-containing protein [Proteobacteria bacterium]|nr:HAMP domain-containing protein [Pseudomonadota bacterium]MBW3616244.1 HAMP domain-containing protein [Pseudomonadota bacterium]